MIPSRKERRAAGSPETKSISSGAKRTLRTVPTISGGRTSPRLIFARLARPEQISTSTVVGAEERTTRACTTAAAAPWRTNAASPETLWDDRVDR